jgi:hypothetical protein
MSSRIAIIGDGAAALAVFGVLRRRGVSAEQIAVYGDHPRPLSQLSNYAEAVGQRQMRSEGNGHLSPHDFPGLALIDAWQRRSPLPLVAALFDAYTPSLALLQAHTEALAYRLGFAECHTAARIGALERHCTLPDLFSIYSDDGRARGTANHVILALGHPGLAFPSVLDAVRAHPQLAHAYEPHSFQAGEHVVVIGGGMAAVHTWLAALDAGAQVTALHRRPLRHQRLNAPRCFFSTAAIERYRSLGPDERRAYLRELRRGSFPWRWAWRWRLGRAQRSGHFVARQGELAGIAVPDRLELRLANDARLSADRLICATGFQTDALAHPLVRQLVATYAVPTLDGMLLLDDQFSIARLSRPNSWCAVVGALARWALPVADTFIGMKYAARRIVAYLVQPGDSVLYPRSLAESIG